MTCAQCGTLNPPDRNECIRCKSKLRIPEMEGKIPCANHANREATTGCASCGQRLCAACAVTAHGVDFCDNCAPTGALRIPYEQDYVRVPLVDLTTAKPASFGSRFLALLLDTFVLASGAIIVALLFWLFGSSLEFLSTPVNQPFVYWLYRAVIALGTAAYVILLTAMNGQTLGKQVAGIIVLQPDGCVITLRASALRFLASVISALVFGLGFLWALWDRRRETWHDKIAQTRVYPWERNA